MANSLSNQIRIGLEESLNMNTNKAEIKEFAGFNKRNSPFINGGISPLFKQEKTGTVIDKEGNVYKCENGNFYKNDVVIATGIEQQEFVRTKVDAPSDPNTKWCLDSSMNIFSAKINKTSTSEYSEAEIVVSYKGYTYTIQNGYINVQVGSLCNYYQNTRTGAIRRSQDYLYLVCWSSVENYGTGYYGVSVDLFIFRDTGSQSVPISLYCRSGFDTKSTTDPESAQINRVVVGYNKNFDLTIVDSTGTHTSKEEAFYVQCFNTPSTYMKSENYTIGYVLPKEYDGHPISGRLEPSSNDPELFLVKETKLSKSVIGSGIENKWTNAMFFNGKFITGSEFHPAYYIGVKKTITSSSQLSEAIFTPVSETETGMIGYILPGSISANNNYVFCDGETFYANGIITINGKKVSVSHHDGVAFRYGEGYQSENTISKNFPFVDYCDMFTVLYNNNAVSGISFNGTLLTPFLDVSVNTDFIVQHIVNPNISDSSQKQGIMYKSASDNCFYTIFRQTQSKIKMTMIEDRYILMNTVGFYNGYDTKNEKFVHLCSDMNNRFYLGKAVNSVTLSADIINNEANVVSTGINANYEIKMNPLIGTIFNPQVLFGTLIDPEIKIENPNLLDPMTDHIPNESFLYKGNFIKSTFNGDRLDQFVDIYNFVGDSGNIPVYKYSYYLNGEIPFHVYDKDLIGVNYPVSTDGNIILSPSFFATFYDSQIGADYIKDGRYYNLIYYEGMPILAYYYGSGVANSEARFVIQGQSFVIRNGLIYSTTYNNGLMYVNDAIVNVDDLQFIGCVPMAAFFFSPATKCVLAFTGDRNLQTSFEATEMESVITYKYVANNNSLYLATPSAVYVLYNTADGSSYIYKIDIADVTDFVALNDGSVALKVGTTWNILSFFEKEDFERIPVKLSTCFYGAGLNRVSTIDCWYIRLFSDTAEKGSVKVKVTTMTNISISSEEQVFPISKEKWQENNGIVYLRYQPKLQRSVGCSLNIESDFAIYDIQASIKPDSAIQITKESGI